MKEEVINKSIGARILAFRKNRNITRSRLAQVIGITQQQLDKYERGVNRISGAKLAIISKEYDISISYFFNDLLLERDLNNREKENSEDKMNLLLNYFINIKKSDTRQLVLSIMKDLSEV